MSFKKLFRSMLTRSLRAPKSSPARRPQRSLGRQLETLEDRTVPALLSLYQAEGNALDSEGTNNGTLNNGVAFTTGVFGQAFNFDGVNDYVSTTRQIQNDFSIAAWIKTTAAGVGTQFYHGNPVITAEVGGVTNDFGTTIINGKFAFGVGAPDQTIQSTTTVNDGNWHHVVAERQGTTIRVYVDGNLETSLTGTHSGALNANANITFGGDLVNGIFYPGALDDVRIYDEAIPQSAISILAQRGQTTTANFNNNLLPGFLEQQGPSATIAGGQAQFNGGGDGNRTLLRTVAGDYYNRNFVAEADVNTNGNISFFGMGVATPTGGSNEPAIPTVNLRLHTPAIANGRADSNDNYSPNIVMGDAGTFPGLGTTGPHRLRLVWDGTTHTGQFFLDLNYAGGTFITDITGPSINGADNGFTAANSHIFFGSADGVAFDNLIITSTPVLPSLSATFDGANNLVIADLAGNVNNLTLSSNGTSLTITDATEKFQSAPAGGVLSNNSQTLTIPIISIFGPKVIFNTGAANDSLTANLATNIGKIVDFNGGTQTGTPGDSLTVTGGSFATVTHRLINASDGSVTAGTNVINYTGLEPVTDNLSATNRVFDFTGGSETIALSDTGGADGKMTITSTLAESVNFTNPTASLTIMTTNGTGPDSVTITSVDAAFNASTTITSTTGDTANLNAALTLAAGNSLNVTSGTINVNAVQTTSGAGSVSLTGRQNIDVNANITGGTGGTSITGQGTSALNTIGVTVNGAAVSATGSGAVSVTGTGGSGSGTGNYGVFVQNAGQVSSGVTGTVTISGTGGSGSGINNYGVVVSTAGLVTSGGTGAVMVTGTGGSGNGGANAGVYVASSGQITSGGAGTVTVQGTGGGGATGQFNFGTYVTGTNSKITSGGGNVGVTGMGGPGTIGLNHGVVVDVAGLISSGGTGIVTVTGTGGTGAASSNFGVYVFSGGVVTSGGAGAVTVMGTGGAGTITMNFGVAVESAGSKITSGGGNVAVTGNAGGSGAGSSNDGIRVSSSGLITATGAGTVMVTGTGGTATGNSNRGVLVFTAGQITSAGGAVSVTGTGGGTGASAGNFGVSVDSAGGGTISSPSTLNVTGTKGANTTTGISVVGAGNTITAVGLATFNGPSASNVLIDSPATANFGSLTVSAAGAIVDITEDSSTALNTIVAATITLTSAGAISDNNGPSNNVTGTSLEIIAATGIGTGDAIETAISNLAANGGTGGVFITNTGSLTITTLTSFFGVTTVGVTGVGATISTTQNLTVSQPVAAGAGAASLLFGQGNAGNSALINAPVTGTSATLTGGTGSDTITVNAMGATNLTVNGGGGTDLVTVNTTHTAGAPGTSGAGAVFLTDVASPQTYIATITGVGSDIIDVNDQNQAATSPPTPPLLPPIAPTPAITTATGPATVATNGFKALDYTLTANLTTLNLVETTGTNTYNVQFVNAAPGSKLPATTNIQTSTTADTANLYGTTNATDTIDVGFTTAGTTSSAGKSVTYPQAAGAHLLNLNVYGRDEPNTVSPAGPAAVGDTFRLYPDAFTLVNIFGGLPADGFGDTLILNAFGLTNPALTNPAGVPGSTAIPNGKITSSNKATATWDSIETLPVPLGLGGTFDFQTPGSATQPGFLPVLSTDTPTSGAYAIANVGWVNPGAGSFDRFSTFGAAGNPSSPQVANLLRDGEWGYSGGGSNNGQFQVTVAPNQLLQVTTYIGDTYAGRDNTNVYVGTLGNPLGTKLNPSIATFNTASQTFQYVSYSGFINPGSNTTLVVTFETAFGGASSFWTVSGLDVRPLGLVAPLTLARVDGNPASTPVVADGLTVDQYTGIGAVPFAEVTINPQFGSPRTFAGTTVDTDTSVKGFQVTADAKGNFAFGVLRETGSGPATISVTDVTGQSGTGVVGPTGSGPLAATPNPYLLPNPFIQSYVLPAGRRIDFGPTGSPAASDSDPANPNYLAFGNAAYVSTVANALGWVGTAPQTLDRGAAFNNLQRDAVFGTPSTPGDFEFDLLPGTTYSVTAVLGDALNQENGMFIQVVDAATGLTIQSTPASGVNTPAGQSTSFTFPVTTDGLGRGRVRFGVSTSPSNAFWTLQDLEIRPTQGVLTISNPGPVLADGTTSTAYTITGATPNALITVTTSLGTITTADAGTTYTSLQVLANGAGVATFAITSPASTSNTTGTISASGVTGLKIGTLAQSYTGVVPPPPPTSPPAAVVARYDFNSGASPTSAGFTGVLPSTLYTASSGFGWKTAVNGYDRGNGTGGSPTTLFQDGAWGYGSGIFEVGVATGAARDVRLYYGDPYTGWTGISVKVEGNPTAALVDSVVDRYGFVTLSGSDANSDGILDITVLGGVWVASGLDIATTGGLPAPATPAASPLTAGVGRRLEFASPAIAGFTSVSNSATYTPGTGFGWEAAVNSFSRPASQFPAGSPLTPTQKQFYGNGAYNSGVSTFAIAVPLGAPGATYSIRAYVADPYTTWQGISLQGEGTAAQTVSSSVSPPASVTITGIADLNGDGIITLTMNGSPWVLNGLDVIDNTGVLPAAP